MGDQHLKERLSVIIPFFGDQHFWGWRVHELGAGPKWIPRKKLTAESLAGAIRQAVSSEGMRQRAAELGDKIQSEDGVKSAGVEDKLKTKDLAEVLAERLA